jgi:hypothetical protein
MDFDFKFPEYTEAMNRGIEISKEDSQKKRYQ